MYSYKGIPNSSGRHTAKQYDDDDFHDGGTLPTISSKPYPGEKRYTAKGAEHFDGKLGAWVASDGSIVETVSASTAGKLEPVDIWAHQPSGSPMYCSMGSIANGQNKTVVRGRDDPRIVGYHPEDNA